MTKLLIYQIISPQEDASLPEFICIRSGKKIMQVVRHMIADCDSYGEACYSCGDYQLIKEVEVVPLN